MQDCSPSGRKKQTAQQLFVPCATELAYCTDCLKNRQQGNCPRQKQILCGGKKFGSRSEKKT